MKIFRMGIGRIAISEFEQAQRLAGFHAQGLVRFCAKLVRARVCFFDWPFYPTS